MDNNVTSWGNVLIITKQETTGWFNAACSTNFNRNQTCSNPVQHRSTCQGGRRSYRTQQTHPVKRSSWGQTLLYENLMTASQRETDEKIKVQLPTRNTIHESCSLKTEFSLS